MVTSVAERTIGPFFARRGTGAGAAGLVAWVSGAEGSGRRVIVVSIDANGVPRSGETVVANVSVDTTMLVVRPMRGPAPGFILAWTSLTDRGESLFSIAVDDAGQPRNKPVELTRTTDDVVWIDVLPTALGALALWAEETREGDANLVAAPLNTDGKVHGSPTRVARGIVGWHAIELPTGVGVSLVAAAPDEPKMKLKANGRSARSGGALSFHRLDIDGHPTTEPVTITTKPIVSGDVEVTRDGSRVAFAWTDRSAEEPSISIAAVDDKNVVSPPRKLASARGGASLLSLTSGNAGLAILFEAPARRKGESRHVHVARVLPELVLERRPLSLDIATHVQPELAATSSGFAVLATMADCEPDSPSCANAKTVATLLRADDKLGVVQREPLDFQADPATMGWGLTCDGDACFALAASPGSPGSPSRIRTATVRSRINRTPTSPKSSPAVEGPHVVDIAAVASGESIVDIATARFGETSLVALLGAASESVTPQRSGTRGAEARVAKVAGVTLTTRVVDENGATSTPIVISKRALPIGGVAIAGTDKPEDGGAIAWVARENGDPEVHVTRIDKRGKRTNDVQLTTTKGDASDVTITWAGNGWIVAWVDGRDGNGEVYATKVSLDLSRIAREERITRAPGDASDLVALPHNDTIWLAWADSRESPRDGIADIYVTAVRTRDAKRAFEEQRIVPTAAHSRTPHLASSPNEGETYVAWIEEAPMGSATPTSSGYGAFWAKLDAAGKPTEKPTRVPLAGDGAATSVVIEATPSLHAVVARSTPDAISLDAIDLATPSPRASSLLALDGPPSLDVALVLDGNALYFNDDGPQKVDRRARRAHLSWTAPK